MASNRVQIAKKLIVSAEIQSVSVVEAKLARDGKKGERKLASSSQQQGRMRVTVSHSGKAVVEEGGLIRATIRFALQARETGKRDAKPAFRVDVSFELVYKIPPDLHPSGAELRAFAETNAVFNAWPYWREFVQSMTARTNLPPLTLPLFRVLS
jgi:preprotein translocase subunit SecB